MMRVTLKSTTSHMKELISDKYADLAKIQEELSTGKQLLQPSDDPISVANDLKLRSTASVLAQNAKNITDGLNFMQVADTAMQSMNTTMRRLRELAVQASSDTLTSSDRSNIQQEEDQLFRQMISLVDTNYNGDYIFGGTQNKVPPFPIVSSVAASASDYRNLSMAYFNGATAGVGQPAQIKNAFDNSVMTNILPGSLKLSSGSTYFVEGRDYTVDYVNGTITPLNAALAVDISDAGTFAGPNYQAGGFSLTFDSIGKAKDVFGNTISNGGDIVREIEPGVVTPINIAGDDLITNRQTGTDMITSLIRMGQNLIQNNQKGISGSITNIDNVFQAIINAQSKNGARINRFQTTQTRNEEQVTQNSSLQSKLEDADMADAATRFSLIEMVYTAALKSASMAIQPSLVNYL
jgi:flagellar hook-associated protein 3 FlgL